MIWHLRKGVTFHDGTPFNAEAAKWNFQVSLDAGRLTDGQFVKSLDVIDEYTLRMNLSEYTSMAFEDYGWAPMFSPNGVQGERRKRVGPDARSRDWSLQTRRLQAGHLDKVRALRCLLAQRFSPTRWH